jgi:hypothetical protein
MEFYNVTVARVAGVLAGAYVALVSYTCPCDRIFACHWHSVAAAVLVAGGLLWAAA